MPFHPNLNVELHSEFAPELIQGVLASRLDLALITHPGENPRLTTTKLSEAPLYVVISEVHPLASKESLQLGDLAGLRWVVFDRRTHPPLHDTLMNLTHAAKLELRGIRHVMRAEEAAHLLARGSDVAFLTRADALRIARHGFVTKPLDESELRLDAHLVARAYNESKLVSEFVQTYVTQVRLCLIHRR